MEPLPKIPTPGRIRWREFRYRVLPVLAMAAAVVAAARAWRDLGSQAEYIGFVQTNAVPVATTVAGLVEGLAVARHDRVEAGRELARVVAFDPELTRAGRDAVVASMDALETRLQWTELGREQTYAKLGLDLIVQTDLLNVARTNLRQAEVVVRRDEELIRPPEPAIPLAAYQADVARRDVLAAEVADRSRLVSEWQSKMTNFASGGTNHLGEIHPVIRRDIEAKQRLLAETQKPLVLRAPVSGTVSTVSHVNGERVGAGTSLLTLVPDGPRVIMGFARQPLRGRPKPGQRVRVWTRSFPRRSAEATLLTVGTQLEPLPAFLQPALHAPPELALPVTATLPAELELMPGETVDLRAVSP